MNLAQAKTGQPLTITGFDDHETHSQLIRMGLSIGDDVQCLTKVSGGPTIIQRGQLQVAIGAQLAQQIHVQSRNNA